MQKKLADKLVEEKSENIDGKEMVYNETLNDYRNAWNPCTWNSYLPFLITIIAISSVFIYFHLYLKRINSKTTSYYTCK